MATPNKKNQNKTNGKGNTNETTAKNNVKKNVKPEAPKEIVKEETPNEEPTITGTQDGNTVTASQPSEEHKDVLTLEPGQEDANIPPAEDNKPDPVDEALKLIADRKVSVFWHKACSNDKETTKTTLYARETLKKTDGTVTLPNPEYKDAETTPDVPQTITKDVYSLKRSKRIYYLHDVSELDIVKASRAKAAEDKAKADEKASKEASETK